MKTNFFENIAAMNALGKWIITINNDAEGIFTVSTLYAGMPSGDNATKAIPPLLTKGTASEMDEGYFEAIQTPVKATAGFYTSTEAYLKSLEKARLNSKMVQDKKGKNNTPKPAEKAEDPDEEMEMPEPQPSAAEKKKAYDGAMKKVNDLNTYCKYAEALEALPSESDYPEKEAELKAKRADLTRKKEQMSKTLELFNA